MICYNEGMADGWDRLNEESNLAEARQRLVRMREEKAAKRADWEQRNTWIGCLAAIVVLGPIAWFGYVNFLAKPSDRSQPELPAVSASGVVRTLEYTAESGGFDSSGGTSVAEFHIRNDSKRAWRDAAVAVVFYGEDSENIGTGYGMLNYIAPGEVGLLHVSAITGSMRPKAAVIMDLSVHFVD